MVCCDACDEWYHFLCAGVKRKDLGDVWFCPACEQKSAKVKQAKMKKDKRQSSPASSKDSDKRPLSQASGSSSDKRPPNPEKKMSSDKRHSSRHTTAISQVSRHSRSPGRSVSVQRTEQRVSTNSAIPPADSYLGSLYTRSEASNWTGKRRTMAIEMQRIEEERRLRSQRDREYLDEKYRFLSMDKQEPDDVDSIRKTITGAWVDHHSGKSASLHHDKAPTEPRSVKSFIRRLGEIQIDNTSPRKVGQKTTETYRIVQCVVCDVEGDERTFVTCCLCNKQGHHECLETIVIGKDVLWICFICKTTIPPSTKKPQVNESKEIPIQRRLFQQQNLETTDHQAQHCGTCGKGGNKPFRSCDICDVNYILHVWSWLMLITT